MIRTEIRDQVDLYEKRREVGISGFRETGVAAFSYS